MDQELAEALEDFISAHIQSAVEQFPSVEKQLIDGSRYVLTGFDQDYENLAAIWHKLPSPNHFIDDTELLELLSESTLTSIPRIFGDPAPRSRATVYRRIADLARELAATLTAPPETFTFQVPLCRMPEICLSLEGSHELVVGKLDPPTPFPGHLSGKVQAKSWRSAYSRANACAVEFAGCLWALGLAMIPPPLEGFTPSVLLRLQARPKAVPEDLAVAEPLASIITALRFCLPDDLTDLEKKDNERALDRKYRQLASIYAKDGDRERQVRNASRLAAHALVSSDTGMALVYSFMSLEGLLLDRSDTQNVLARLSEALAYSLYTSDSDRRQLRKRIKKLYESRSIYAHAGNAKVARKDLWHWIHEVVQPSLRKEIESLSC